MYLSKRITVFVMMAGMLFMLACAQTLPDQDLQAARAAIRAAEAAQAEKYDPENLSAAKEQYKKALQLVADERNQQAGEEARASRIKADLAAENARRRMAEEAIYEAERMITRAEERRAGFLASDEMTQAEFRLSRAKESFNEKKYDQAFTDAQGSKEAAGRAADQAEQKYQDLQRVYSDADMSVRRAGASEAVNQYAQSELEEARMKLATAKDNKEYVDNPARIQVDSKEQRNTIAAESYKKSYQFAQDARLAAENALKIAQDRENAVYRARATESLDRARRMLEQIRELKEQGLIKRGVIAPPPPADPDEMDYEYYEPDGVIYDQEPGMDTESMSNQEKYEAALSALQRAEANYSAEDYRSSIIYSEEAIRLAEAIRITMNGGTSPDPQLSSDQKYYTVRLIPHARDCLWRIASYDFIYGDAKLWPRIWQANKHLIEDPDLIFPGQRFVIPPK